MFETEENSICKIDTKDFDWISNNSEFGIKFLEVLKEDIEHTNMIRYKLFVLMKQGKVQCANLEYELKMYSNESFLIKELNEFINKYKSNV